MSKFFINRPIVAMVVSIIMMSKAFTSVLVISGGGPNGASTVIGLYIYQAAFQFFQMGMATAVSMLLLASIMLLTIFQLWLFRDTQPLLRFGPRTIREKVMFGTGWFLLGRPPGHVLDEFRELPIPDDVMELWLHGNAERMLGVPVAA